MARVRVSPTVTGQLVRVFLYTFIHLYMYVLCSRVDRHVRLPTFGAEMRAVNRLRRHPQQLPPSESPLHDPCHPKPKIATPCYRFRFLPYPLTSAGFICAVHGSFSLFFLCHSSHCLPARAPTHPFASLFAVCLPKKPVQIPIFYKSF